MTDPIPEFRQRLQKCKSESDVIDLQEEIWRQIAHTDVERNSIVLHEAAERKQELIDMKLKRKKETA